MNPYKSFFEFFKTCLGCIGERPVDCRYAKTCERVEELADKGYFKGVKLRNRDLVGPSEVE